MVLILMLYSVDFILHRSRISMDRSKGSNVQSCLKSLSVLLSERMKNVVFSLLRFLFSLFRSRLSLQTENMALRHQLSLYQRSDMRPNINPTDRIFWSWLSRAWSRWREVLVFVKPATVIAWQRKRFREHWANLSRKGKPGRPAVSKELQELIRTMSQANPLWGSPRILGELKKLGIDVAKSTIEKYMVRQPKPPSQNWRTFLKNHMHELVSIDFFVVPTVRFEVIYVFVVLHLERRQVLHFNVTKHPTSQWTIQQLREAFAWGENPRYLMRDRDAIYGPFFRQRVKSMGIEEVVTAPRSPWQNPYIERFFGSIRRDCLDHVIVLNEKHLKCTLLRYFSYYHSSRTHLGLDMDCPEPRKVQTPELGEVVAFPEVGGLHHRYERQAA